MTPITLFSRSGAVSGNGGEPETRYHCTGEPDWECVEDEEGEHATLEDCQAVCEAPPGNCPTVCEECAEMYYLTLAEGEMVCMDGEYYLGCHGTFSAHAAGEMNPCEWWWAEGDCHLDISCGSGVSGHPGNWWEVTLKSEGDVEKCSWIKVPTGSDDCPDGVYALNADNSDCESCPETITIYS